MLKSHVFLVVYPLYSPTITHILDCSTLYSHIITHCYLTFNIVLIQFYHLSSYTYLSI